jgi:adenylate cyclase
VSTDDPGRLRRLNRDPRWLKGARLVRQWLPGDQRYGDPLSTGGSRPSEVAGRQLSELTRESPGVMRELGLGAVQVWQAFSEAQGRGRGDVELAIVFTDLSGFSSWALE